MQENFELDAVVRTDMGKGASRRLRRENGVPAIIYGGDADPMNITLKHNELAHHLENEAFYSHVLKLNVDGKTERAILRDLQRHPFKPIVMHADFQRVDNKTQLKMNVPLHFINEEVSVGVKAGGIAQHVANEVEISCLAKDLPEYIEVDLANLDLGGSIHLSEISLPAGVEIVALQYGADHDSAVVSIIKPRGASEEEEETAEGESTEEAGEE